MVKQVMQITVNTPISHLPIT